jgi:hypothetical protein
VTTRCARPPGLKIFAFLHFALNLYRLGHKAEHAVWTMSRVEVVIFIAAVGIALALLLA